MKGKVLLAPALCLLVTACAGGPVEKNVQEPSPPEQVEEQVSLQERENGKLVYTDWSQLGEPAGPLRPVGTRWYEDYTDHLIPREDYGELIPYAGLRLMDDWPANSGCMYGLMTPEGKVVTDPVYSSVSRAGCYDTSGQWQAFPLLILEQGREGANESEGNLTVCAVAALDGSWCTPFDYQAYAVSTHGLLLFRKDSLTVMDAGGEIQRIWTVAEAGIPQEQFDTFLSEISWGEGWSGQRRGDYMALGWEPESDYTRIRGFNLVTGDIHSFVYEEWETLDGNYFWPEEQEYAVPNAERLRDTYLGDSAPGLLVLSDYSDAGIKITYYRDDGTPIPELTRFGERWDQQVSVVAGLVEVLDWNMVTYYDLDTWECVFRASLNYEGD